MKKSGIAAAPTRKRRFEEGGDTEGGPDSPDTPDTPESPNTPDYESDMEAASAAAAAANAEQEASADPNSAVGYSNFAGTGIGGDNFDNGNWGNFFDSAGKFQGSIQDASKAFGMPASYFNNVNNPGGIAALAKLSPTLAAMMKGINTLQDKGLPGYVGETALDARRAAGMGVGGEGTVSDPFGQTSTAATTTTPPDSKAPLYVWNGTQYVKNDGTATQSRSDTQGMFAGAQTAAKPQVPDTAILPMGFAGGGKVGIAAGAPTQARYIDGPGDGQSDSVPVKMDDGGQGYLADGEFVIDATTVAGLGNGSSKAGAKLLYDMVARIRTQAHGQNKLQNPVNPDDVLPA